MTKEDAPAEVKVNWWKLIIGLGGFIVGVVLLCLFIIKVI